MESSDRLAPLREAVAADPANGGLRLVYADALTKAGRLDEATLEYQALFAIDALPPDDLVLAGQVAIASGAYTFASSLADRAHEQGDFGGAARLRVQVGEALEQAHDAAAAPAAKPSGGWLEAPSGPEATTFADVGGLAEVKKTIERVIVLPFRQTETYVRYGRKAGGGILLYGPPGCGKTLLARATAGECSLPFLNIRIEDIVDPYFGVSEQKLHTAFAEARQVAPCVVFMDELDAIGTSRRRGGGGTARRLVDQLLQELDSIGSDNEGILVLAATNAPWDVDEALKRPGRFDRTVFVPPPDREGREAILDVLLRDRPVGRIDVRRMAERTSLFSGADLASLVEHGIDRAIDEALETGVERPLSDDDFEVALRRLVPSTLDWIGTARRYVEFANDSGRYDDVERYLRTREAKAAQR